MGVSAWSMNRYYVWCLIGWAQLNGTTSNGVKRLIEMIKKICVGYQQEGIDPPLGLKTLQLWSDIVPNGENP